VFGDADRVPPGVLMTRTPRRVASCKSMLSTPTPARPTARSLGAFRKEVWRDARGAADDERVGIGQLRAIVSFVVTTTFRRAFS